MGSDETPESLAKAYPQYEHRSFVELFDEAPVHPVRITRPFYRPWVRIRAHEPYDFPRR